jgi:hypothetical protein
MTLATPITVIRGRFLDIQKTFLKLLKLQIKSVISKMVSSSRNKAKFAGLARGTTLKTIFLQTLIFSIIQNN